MDLAEQAEREIADQLGFSIGMVDEFPRLLNGLTRPDEAAAASSAEIILWEQLVRDRCSLLKLKSTLEDVEAILCLCDTPNCNCDRCAARVEIRKALGWNAKPICEICVRGLRHGVGEKCNGKAT